METLALGSTKATWLAQIKKVTNKNQKIIAFIAATFIFYLAQKSINAKIFLGDAKDYWYLSSYIWDFSFPQNLRGYFFPLLLSPAKYLSEIMPQFGYLPLRILQAVAYSYSLCIIFPNLFIKIFGGADTLPRRLIVPSLVAIFFPGLVSYPLSDLPALTLTFISVYLLICAKDNKSPYGVFPLVFLAGMVAYGACNTRSIYVFTLTALTIAVPLVIFRSNSITTRTFATLTFIAGAATCSTPQVLINMKHFDNPSPFVISKIGDASLFATQLKWGITIQRYETLLDEKSETVSGIYYFDPAGETFFKKYGMTEITATVPWYLDMVLSEPVEFSKIYLKHFINGIDVRDHEVYTTSPSHEKKLRSAISLSVFFLGLFFLVRGILERTFEPSKPNAEIIARIFWAFVFIIPVAAIIPGAIETRFFLPLQVLCYGAIAFKFCMPRINNLLSIKNLAIAVAYAIVLTYSIVATNSSILSRYSIIFEDQKAPE
ncbi:hypothetical protein LOY55_10575 [Pseudomonas sp. B21-040]|uniref:hypothetical protein n=1 Tax=unclassified Pseudomonas TaxID=196821 RepID=UPI001CBDAC92|nr:MULTISPECIES: hypothetical protein [unclassified Pseudomonas]UVL42510.1 hypothetical protein LOY55_10575 [Pseudomonas sp. B21-040]